MAKAGGKTGGTTGGHRDQLVAWALARLAAKAPARAVRATRTKSKDSWPLPPKGDALALVAARFALDGAAQRALALVWAAELSPAVARAMRLLGGASGPTVEVLGAALGPDGVEWERALAPDAPLRARGLLVLSGMPRAQASSRAAVELAPGVAARLAGRAVPAEALGPGIERLLPPSGDPSEVGGAVDVLRALPGEVSSALAATPARVAIGHAPGLARALATSLARRDRRAVLLVDGRTVGALGAAWCWSLLAAVRREAELEGASLVVDQSARLGGAHRALVEPALDASVTALVLIDDGAVLDGGAHPQLALCELAVAAPPAAAVRPHPVADAIEAARRQAAIDAAKAMGRPFPFPTSAAPPTPTAAPSASAFSTQPPAAPPRASDPRADRASDPRADRASDPRADRAGDPRADRASDPRADRAIDPSLIEGARVPASRRGKGTVAAGPEEKSAPVPVAPEAPAPLSAATPFAPAPAAPTAAAAGGEPPPLEIPATASVPELITLTSQTPNPRQRADLLRRLGSLEHRDVSVVALLRAHLRAEDAAVRSAAEEGMVHFFGPNWNRTRTIPKPIQPPRSDD